MKGVDIEKSVLSVEHGARILTKLTLAPFGEQQQQLTE